MKIRTRRREAACKQATGGREPEINLKTLKGAARNFAVKLRRAARPPGTVRDVEKDVISKQTALYHS